MKLVLVALRDPGRVVVSEAGPVPGPVEAPLFTAGAFAFRELPDLRAEGFKAPTALRRRDSD